jgi:hypothetical protein
MVAPTATLVTARVRVVGIVRGREIDTTASATIDQDSLVLAWEQSTPWRLALTGIEGIGGGHASLTVYLIGNDVLELSGDDQLRVLGLQLLARACVMPELTRGLKALGSSRGTPTEAHDRWFSPLLAARRSVEGVSDPVRQVALLDPRLLTAALVRAIAEIAAVKAPGDVAEQRAIEAALEEEADTVFTAIDMMAMAGDVVLGGALDTRIADWRQWVDMVRAVYAAADEAWASMSVELR